MLSCIGKESGQFERSREQAPFLETARTESNTQAGCERSLLRFSSTPLATPFLPLAIFKWRFPLGYGPINFQAHHNNRQSLKTAQKLVITGHNADVSWFK